MSLQRTLLVLIAAVLLAALIPAGVALDRRLASALEARAREDLATAPRLLADRREATRDALMMHAKDLTRASGLVDAITRADRDAARRVLDAARGSYGEEALLVTATGAWAGPTPPAELVRLTRGGEMPVAVVATSDGLRTVALAPVMAGDRWLGAAGVAVALDRAEAERLSGLTGGDVVILDADGAPVAATVPPEVAGEIARASGGLADGRVRAVRAGDRRFLAIGESLDAAATVAFLRDLDEELAVLPELRRVAGVSVAVALVLALALGALFAVVLARPVRALASAADRLAAGDFDAPLPTSAVTEVRRVAQAFHAMRQALAARLRDLEDANRELEDRQARLSALQAELIRRDRLAATGRLVAQLAHEIRNPVANVRNSLELVHRRLSDDPEAREFVDLAIDELLRMHELAEQMLNVHRPRDPTTQACDATAVAREVTALVRAGSGDEPTDVACRAPSAVRAGISADALKQVLINLVQNAREAIDGDGSVEIRVARRDAVAVVEVLDDGPGIPADVVERIFDPFFTTKGGVQGVGLGLYVAEGIVRSCGGRITAHDRAAGGACFRLELPLAMEPDESPASGSPRSAPARHDGGGA